jgi:L-rhamnose isomerase
VAGPQARVLVDMGHHLPAQNIEQIVAWLLHTDLLGGFHFNDRRYADDDLTLGSIDPYQIFRIFHEIALFEWETGRRAEIAYMVDQSHNLKDKIEETIQTAVTAQELYAKAALVDHAAGAPSEQGRAGGCRRVPEGCFRHRRAPGHPRMAQSQRHPGRADEGLPRKRLPGARRKGTGREERRCGDQLCINRVGQALSLRRPLRPPASQRFCF